MYNFFQRNLALKSITGIASGLVVCPWISRLFASEKLFFEQSYIKISPPGPASVSLVEKNKFLAVAITPGYIVSGSREENV